VISNGNSLPFRVNLTLDLMINWCNTVFDKSKTISLTSEAGINSDGLLSSYFGRSNIIQLVIGRWEGQFGPDG